VTVADVHKTLVHEVLGEHPRNLEFLKSMGLQSMSAWMEELADRPMSVQAAASKSAGYLGCAFMLGYVLGLLHPEERPSIAKGVKVL
jgi:hypothetical protein